MKIKVSIVEDDPTISQSWTQLLNMYEKIEVLGCYGSCEDFFKNLTQNMPDVVLMDIELPGMNGIDGIAKLRKVAPQVKIIVVTVYENDDLVFKALCAGAGGYLTKNLMPSRLIEAIKEIHQGGAPMSTNIARKVVASFQRNTQSPLSNRELEVLELLAKGKSYSVIAEELFVEKETIRTHIKNIYWKLEVHSKADALAVAKKEKYI